MATEIANSILKLNIKECTLRMASLSSQVLSSSFLLLVIRLIQRSIGLISTLILARVLTPNDFGIVAISLLVVHFCDALSATGSQQYIVQKVDVDSGDINSAWTIDIIMKSVLWVVLVILVPYISSFYERPEIENALYVSSLVLLIGAFKSPGLILLKRALAYKPIFRISIVQKLLSFIVVMTFVYFEPSYWALIIGDLVSTLTLTIGSYYTHKIRPKFCLTKIREQWAFSQWVLFKGGLGYVRAEADTILVSKYFPSDALGAYHLARHLSIMPSTEIIGPTIEPLVASFAKVKNDPPRLAYQFSLSLLILLLLITPASMFMWSFPELIIDFFLGEQWGMAIPVLSALSLILFTSVVGMLLNQYCIALGKVKSLFIYELISLFVVFFTLLSFVGESLVFFSWARGTIAVIITVIFFLYVSRISSIINRHIIKLISPIFLIVSIAAYLTMKISFNLFEVAIVNLLIYLTIFGSIYILGVIFSYFLVYRYTREGQYLKGLALKFFNKIIKIHKLTNNN